MAGEAAAGCGQAARSSAGCLEERAFPRFAPLLEACQEYAASSGCRFCLGDFGLPEGRPAGGPESLPGTCERRVEVVREFSARLLAGESALTEELERASRAVISESLRNSVLAHCRRLDLWPPDRRPPDVVDSDCSYEDTAAPLDVIAQRAHNDEARRRARGDGAEARRAATASFLLDFAAGCGAVLPPMPETFATMLEELQARVAEWEEQADQAPRGDLRGLGGGAADRLLPWPAPGLPAGAWRLLARAERVCAGAAVPATDAAAARGEPAGPSAPPSRGRQLRVEVQRVSDFCGEVVYDSWYVEAELGRQRARTACVAAAPPAARGESVGADRARADFSGEALLLSRAGEASAVVRLCGRPGVASLLLPAAPPLGEGVIPLGPELEDGELRSIQLPLSRAGAHVGAIDLRYQLVAAPAALEFSTSELWGHWPAAYHAGAMSMCLGRDKTAPG